MASKRIVIGGEIKDNIIRDIVSSLSSIAHKVALEAYRQHSFENRTYNLHDSYGSAVFVNGKLIEESIRYVERSYSKKESTHRRTPLGAETGRKALRRFFDEAKPIRTSDYITVVIAAAMWYAELVEIKGFTVLDSTFVKSEMRRLINNDSELMQKMKTKYGINPLVVRRILGIDEEYHYDL